MKNLKVLKFILVFLIILCLSLGGVGYYKTTTNTVAPPKNDKPDYKISMIYYLNGTQKLTEMPVNPKEETLYKFDKYVCTNNIKGIWNDEKWEFNVSKTADATCKLYFVSAIYNVTINATNGVLDQNAVMKVDTNEDGTFKVIANEGYTYDKTTCTNNEETTWDNLKNEVTIKAIKSDTTCEVLFKLKEYKVEFGVTNGKNIAVQIVKHNQSLTVSITPVDGFNNPTITCNNTDLGQSVTPGTWANDSYTMNSITSNLKCVFEFKAIVVAPTIYQVIFKEFSEGGPLLNTSPPKDVEYGKSTTYDITKGYTIVGEVTECDNDKTTTQVTAKNITRNTECRIVIKKIE